VCSPQGSQVVD